MIVVVEIISRTGTRASKEYDAPSYNAAIEAVKRELRAYPTFRVTDIGVKDDGAVRRETEESGELGPARDKPPLPLLSLSLAMTLSVRVQP